MTHEVRRRRRPAKSCTECRRRKVKCDLKSPCGPCAATRANCVYKVLDHESRGHGITGAVASNPAVDHSVPPGRINPVPLAPSGDALTTPKPPRRAEPSHQTGLNTPSEHEHPRPAPPRPEETSQPIVPQPVVAIASSAGGSDPANDSTPAKTRVHLKKTRVLGWSDRMGNDLYALVFNCYKQACGEGETYTGDPETKAVVVEMGRLLQECKSQSQLLKLDRPSRNPLNFNFNLTPPPVESSKRYIDTYFQLFESTHRIVHKPSFTKEAGEFLASPEEASLATRLKILLVIAIGSSLHTPAEGSEISVGQIQQWVYAAHTWLAGPIEKDRLTINALQIQCLAILARQIYSIGGDLAWISASSVMHRAMQMGLHRDPKHFRGMSVLDAEVRRRLWATILELVLQTSLDSAMPPRISFDDFDTESPSHNNDDDFFDGCGSVSPKPGEIFTDTSLQLLLLESFPIRLRVIQILNNMRQELIYADTLSLSSQISDACARSAVAMRSYGTSQFHKNLLDYLQRRFLLPLHCTFANQAHENKLFYYSLKISLDTATTIVSPEPDEHYHRLMSIGGGIFREGLRYAAATLAVEFLSQSEERRAGNASRSDEAQLNALRSTMEAMLSQAVERIRGGETNVKNHMFLKMILAQADALDEGEKQKFEVAQAANESLEFCLGLLKARLENVSGPPSAATAVASPVCDYLFSHPMDFEFYMENPNFQFPMNFNAFS